MCARAPQSQDRCPRALTREKPVNFLKSPLCLGLWEGEALPAISLVCRRLSPFLGRGEPAGEVLGPEVAHLEKQGAEKLLVCALPHGPLMPSLVPRR